jgi:hypothetical protein
MYVCTIISPEGEKNKTSNKNSTHITKNKPYIFTYRMSILKRNRLTECTDLPMECTFLHNVFCLRSDPLPFQVEFSTKCDLVLPLSTFNILSFTQGHQVAAYVFFLFFPSLLSFLVIPSIECFRRQFIHKTWPIHFLYCIRMFHSCLILRNTFLFLTF